LGVLSAKLIGQHCEIAERGDDHARLRRGFMSFARVVVRHAFVPTCLCVLTIICLSGIASGNPQDSSSPALTPQQIAKIDQYVTGEMASERIPGVEVGIYHRGQILLAKGYGLANVELNVPVNPETVFQSGSVGKQFVSAAVMMLVQEGKVSLDDSITKYFPDAPPSWKPILIENLLSHTSGLGEYETRERIAPNGPFYLRLDFTEDELVKKIEALPIDFPVGSNWAYCNTNYVLLGILIHKVTGEFYADFLADRIFKPLGMTSTRLISDADIIPNRASGYRIQGDKLQNAEWVSPTFNSTADGSLYFNVLDLAKWDGALYGTKLLKQSSLDRIWTIFPLNNGAPNPGNYGFGWWINTVNGHRVIEHPGSSEGFTCQISRYVDDNLTVVVLTNLSAGHSHPDRMVHEIAGLINPALMPPLPKEYKEVSIDPKLLDGYVGTYQFASGHLVVITRDADQLFVQPTAQPKVPMFAYGPRDFFLKVADAQITFVTDSSGKATELIVHQAGRDEPAKRIAPTP
jgi:CubicO group peptidase (beta-lactamase class C family)